MKQILLTSKIWKAMILKRMMRSPPLAPQSRIIDIVSNISKILIKVLLAINNRVQSQDQSSLFHSRHPSERESRSTSIIHSSFKNTSKGLC
jgi:hypothetical protein